MLSALPATGPRAEELAGAGEVISLEAQLKTGLRPRLPEENDFLEDVARAVDTGRLPRKLVNSTFVWAIRRRQTYPFPAFERALRMQAEKLGVDL
jgi:hypothetical protein